MDVQDQRGELLQELIEEVRRLREETTALLREMLAKLESIEQSQYS